MHLHSASVKTCEKRDHSVHELILYFFQKNNPPQESDDTRSMDRGLELKKMLPGDQNSQGTDILYVQDSGKVEDLMSR